MQTCEKTCPKNCQENPDKFYRCGHVKKFILKINEKLPTNLTSRHMKKLVNRILTNFSGTYLSKNSSKMFTTKSRQNSQVWTCEKNLSQEFSRKAWQFLEVNTCEKIHLNNHEKTLTNLRNLIFLKGPHLRFFSFFSWIFRWVFSSVCAYQACLDFDTNFLDMFIDRSVPVRFVGIFFWSFWTNFLTGACLLSLLGFKKKNWLVFLTGQHLWGLLCFSC